VNKLREELYMKEGKGRADSDIKGAIMGRQRKMDKAYIRRSTIMKTPMDDDNYDNVMEQQKAVSVWKPMQMFSFH
jgi:hypothetical protein